LNTSQKRTRFKQRWSKDWEVRSDKLVYKPLNLTVVPDGERNTVLKTIYEDLTQGVGQGISLLHKRIRDKYLNIRRSDVGTFLKSQKVYQITRPQNHIINKPVMSTPPNNRWGMDCISMISYASANGGINEGTKFILTVVDYYSRKVWLRPLKSQTAVNVLNQLINIVAETKTFPKILVCDNGGEFKGETLAWMKEHNIQVINTLSYSPESNGLTELKNKLVRNVLREIMILTNSRNWTQHLQTTANLLNTQMNGTTKRAPNSIWREGHELQGEQDRATIRRHEQRVINSVKNNPTTEYKIGDFVRVKMGRGLFSPVFVNY
jgi:IS30 family transposase